MNPERSTIDDSTFIAKALLFGFFLYSGILWIGEYFFRKEYSEPFDEYFLISHLLLLLSSGFLLGKQILHSKIIIDWGKIVPYLGLVLLYFIVIYLKFHEKVIWYDENDQFLYASHTIRSNIIDRSFHHQQPPLDYLLVGFASTYFGNTVLAAKFHSIIWGGLTILLIPQLISILNRFQKSRFTVALLFIFSPLVINYSLEGRPIALTLFASTLFVFFLINYVKDNDNKHNKGKHWLLLASFFLLSTTSAQNHFFILFSFTITTLFYFQKVRWSLIIIGAASALWRLPLDLSLLQIASEQHYFGVEEINFLTKVKSLGINFYTFFSQQGLLQASVICASCLFCLYQYIKERAANSIYPLVMLITFLFGYIYFLEFQTNIPFYSRYLICSLPCIFLILGNSFKSIEEKKPLSIPVASILIIVFGFFSISKPLESFNPNAFRPRWDKSYSYINEQIGKDDVVLQVAFAGLGDFKGESHVGSLFYGNELVKNGLIKYFKNREWLPPNMVYFDDNRDYLRKCDKIFLLINRYDQEAQFWDYHFSSKISHKSFRGVDLLIFQNEGSLYDGFTKLFQQILLKHGVQEGTMPFLEGLIYMENKYGTKKRLRSYIDLYKTVVFRTPVNDRGFYLEKEKEHKKRIKAFEEFYKNKQ